MGQLMIGGRSGARLKYNLFVQPDEPDVKNGLWIKTPSPVSASDVFLKSGYNQAEQWANDDNNEFKNVNFSADTQCDSLYGVNGHRVFDDNFIQDNKYLYYLRTTGSTNEIYQVNIDTGTRTMINNNVWAGVYEDTGQFFKGVLYYRSATTTIPSRSNFTPGLGQDYIFQGAPIYDIQTNTAIPYNAGNTAWHAAFLNNGYEYAVVRKDNSNDLFLYKVDTATRTVSSTTIAYASHYPYMNIILQFMCDNKVFVLLQSTSVAKAFNLISVALDGTMQEICSTTPALVDPTLTLANACFYGGKVYLFFTGDYSSNIETGFINLDTATYTHIGTGSVRGKIELLLRYGTNFMVIPALSQGVNKQDVCGASLEYCLINSIQPNNTLLLQEGNTHEMRVIGVDKLLPKMAEYSANLQASSYFRKSPDFSIDDAWYYDTDFREYPTYIGNGSTWTKIKN